MCDAGVKDKGEICREYPPRSHAFSCWRAESVERAPEILATKRSRGDEQERIAELERMIGRLTMGLEAAQEGRRCVASDDIVTSLSNRGGR